MGGMLSAFQLHPDANWIVVACDLVHFNHQTVEKLLADFQEDVVATAFKNTDGGFPEALCALYTPKAQAVFLDAYKSDVRCPVKVLKNSKVHLIEQTAGINLANINTPEELRHVKH
jgi:cyclic pyranopterin phosphate synthase